MRSLRLVGHQFRFDQKVFWRNPASVFFTAVFPLLFLLIFATFFKNADIHGLGVNGATYYVPAIVALAVISATMVKLAMNLSSEREGGMLKRVRGTPLPPWVFVAGRVGNSVVISVIMVALVSVIGALFYGVPIPTSTLPALLVTLLVGAFAFSCLGFALAAVIPSEDAAPAITNAIVFPLYFLSGIFVPEDEIPSGVLHIADLFPVRHLFAALFAVWDPATSGSGLELGDLAIVLLWGIAGLLVAVRLFRWEPRSRS